MKEFLQVTAKYPDCEQAALSEGAADSEYMIDKNKLIARVAPIDGAVQLVARALCNRIMYSSHHPVMAGHPCQRHLHDSMQMEFYWLHMSKDM